MRPGDQRATIVTVAPTRGMMAAREMEDWMATCPIWGTPAEELKSSMDGVKVRSPRTGGTYRISRTAMTTVQARSDAEKARLTTWIIDQRRSGEESPLVTSAIIDEAVARRPLRMSERKQRFFFLALSRDFQPSSRFKISGTVDDQFRTDLGAIAAWTECRNDEDAQALVRLLEAEGFVGGDASKKTLTGRGFEQMEQLESGAVSTTQAFIAMWFDPSLDAAAAEGFEPAIRDAGYRPLRIDKVEHGNKIDDQIIAEIRRSRFIVADFTCGLTKVGDKVQPLARGGVYYEAGFAQGLGIPVIWTCRADCIEHVHFDTRQFNHIVWTDAADLRTKLLNRIRAVIA